VSFEGEYDEAPLAKLVANRYKTNHTEIKINFNNLRDDIEKIFLNYGEPFADSSAVPSYYVSKEAKKKITVILNGDGADELFGGYRRYVPYAKYDFFKSSAFIKVFSKFIVNILPLSHNRKSYYNYIRRMFDFASKESLEQYLSAGSNIFENYQNHFNTNSDYLKNIKEIIKKVNSTNLTGLEKLMYIDFNTIFTDDLLVKMDIATMANSLEGRSPFLSKEMLEFAPALPDEYKIKNTYTKRILRELSKEYLPDELINQPKRGFEIPLKKWIENDIKDIVFDYISPSNSYSKELINKDFIDNLLNKKVLVSSEQRAKMLWTLLSLEIWYKNYKGIKNG
jgi:asparagine synthase (glutamine-hydrolysing)